MPQTTTKLDANYTARRVPTLEAARHSGAAIMPQIASPFADRPQNKVVWADLLGADSELLPLTREAAIQLPAVAKQRHLIAGSGARLPLRQAQGDVDVPTPEWMTRTDGELSPFHRMLWTYDDLIFSGWSCWRAYRSSTGQLEAADRLAMPRWSVDAAGRIEVDGVVVDAAEVILIPGPHEGILNFSTSIRMAIANLKAASNAARNPSAYTELHYEGDEAMSETDIDALIARWVKARNGANAGVSFTPKHVTVKDHGSHEAQLLIGGRNADAVDMSRLVGSPASMADATNAGASLTYETTTGRNGEFIDYGLALYVAAVDARLSMDDICPKGQRVYSDLTVLTGTDTASPAGPGRED